MQQKVLHGLVLAAVLVFISGASYLLGTQSSTTTTDTEDSEFTTYTSTALEFSMKVPKSLPLYDFCETKHPEKIVEMKVIEDTKYGIAYFVPEYYYDQPSEWNEEMEKNIYSGECQKKIFSLNSFEDYKGRISNPYLGIAMKIAYLPGLDIDKTYGEFLKNAYGKCMSFVDNGVSSADVDESLTFWAPDGYAIHPIKVTEGYSPFEDKGGELFETKECTTGSYFISEEVEENGSFVGANVMTYYHGQEPAFWRDSEGRTTAYDPEMFQSFRFTD